MMIITEISLYLYPILEIFGRKGIKNYKRMKKLLFFLSVVLTMTACGNKTNGAASEADSTIVENEVPDTLNNMEAVVKQVDAVYVYWNELREHYDENKPSVDERFGSKEWQRVRKEVEAVDRECECGGFFDFGDEGPLDAWTYDCYEGAVSANDMKVKFLPDGMAEVKFLVKDAVTTKGVPIRWLMKVEDGQWRVHNIFFEKNDNLDLLMNMRAYADDGKFNNTFDINKYLSTMKEQVAKLQGVDKDEISFNAYGLIDVDLDGTPEVFMQNKKNFYNVVFSIAGGKPSVLANSFGATDIYFFEHGVGAQGGCGTGCMMSDCTIIKDSKAVVNFRVIDEYGMDGELAYTTKTKGDKKITDEEYDKLKEQLGAQLDLAAIMHEIETEAPEEKTDLSDYAE